jgi:4-aminobutyrate aminotransferase-like enzyme
MGWSAAEWDEHQDREAGRLSDSGFFPSLPMTAYNAVTSVEVEASKRLVHLLQERPGGRRFEHVMWAASGSEAIQKALWAALARDRQRDIILATQFGFHGKKGLAGAVTGCETDAERDPRVRFIGFPMEECADVSMRDRPFDPTPYRLELEALYGQLGRRLGVLITEPYLGGGGSYHPPKAYLHLLQSFCREHDIVFVLDEVQSNFGRTGALFAFETYGLEPDVVVLGKSLANGVPIAAAVGRTDVFASLDYGEASDTWSGNPLSCAAVLATLDEFAARDVLGNCGRVSPIIEAGLVRLKQLPFVAHVRGELGGMVWGVEMRDHANRSAADWANAVVLACYQPRGQIGRRNSPARAARQESNSHCTSVDHHRRRSNRRNVLDGTSVDGLDLDRATKPPPCPALPPPAKILTIARRQESACLQSVTALLLSESPPRVNSIQPAGVSSSRATPPCPGVLNS